MTEPAPLRALALVCSLKASPAPSSSDLIARQLLDELGTHGVLERLDAELSETDESGRPLVTGKVAVTAVVGNEDGAHKITADLMQGLDDNGFTIPAQGGTYWNDVAMGSRDYNDLDETPEAVASTNKTLAENAAHLARLLKGSPYPSS